MTKQESIERLRLQIAAKAREARKEREDEIANCEYCKRIAAEGGFGPHHFASPRCESGRRNHCTCDTCF